MTVLSTNNLTEFISRYQVDGVKWKARRLLINLERTSILRDDKVVEISNMLSFLDGTRRDDYVREICAEHELKPKTIEKRIEECLERRQKASAPKKVRKNAIKTLSDPKTFQFFHEVTKQVNGQEVFDKIKVDKLKF